MKLLRLIPALVLGLAAVAAVLAWGAHAAEASGTVTTCDDAHLVTALSGGGLVTFDCGTATLTVTSMKTIASNTTIDGSNNGHPLTLTASSGVQAFWVNSGTTLTLTNILIANTNSPNSAVYGVGPLVVSNSQFISNAHGALYGNSPLTITNALFRANGGQPAVNEASTGSLNVSGSQFISNTAGSITSYASTVVNNSQFYSNTTLGAAGGGGIDLEGTSRALTLSVTNSAFMTNTSYTAAGIYASGGVVTISNTQFVSNTNTNGAGAGVWYQPSGTINSLQILSSTFQSNVNGAVAVNGGSADPMTIANSTFRDNLGPLATSGVSSGGMALTITQSSFIHNVTTANDPGALNAGGPVYGNGNLFQSNVGLFGGAMYLGNGGLPVFTDTVASTAILSNTSQGWDGGGIDAVVPLIVSDSIISGNVMSANGRSGGGLSWQSVGHNLNVSRSLFYNNQATNSSSGGGIYIAGNATLVNTTVYSNSATNAGGVYVANSSGLTLTNDTLVNNAAVGPFATHGNLYVGSITPAAMVNTILASGSPNNCAGTILSLGHNLSSDGTCPLTASGDLSGTNPLLGAFQGNGGPSWTLLPTAYSPAINAGDNAACPSDDQRGTARPIGPNCDIGAVETTFLKAQQTITFNPLTIQNLTTPPFGITATATSGLPVSFSSQTMSVCTVSVSTVTLAAIGTCTLRATQAGNANFFAATNVDQSFTVTTTQQTQSITFNALPNLVLGTPAFNLSASATSGLTVTFSSLTTGVCTVSGNSVSLLAGGTCTLRASQAGNGTYAAAPNVDRSFSVLLSQTINFGPLAQRGRLPGSFTLSASATSGLTVSFGSLTPAVCTVSGSTVSLVAGGTCTIRAGQGGNATYAPAAAVDQSFLILGYVVVLPLVVRGG